MAVLGTVPLPLPDAQALLVRTAGGSRESFAALYDLVAPRVFAVLPALAADGETAVALTEAAFREVWVRAPRYRPESDEAVRWILGLACRLGRGPATTSSRAPDGAPSDDAQ